MKVDKFRTVIIYIIIILLGLVCLLPLLNIVAISFSSCLLYTSPSPRD